MAADVETACRVTGRDPRPRRCAKAKILDRVFRRDAFSIEIIPIILAGPSKGLATRSNPPRQRTAPGSAGAMRSSARRANNHCFWGESLIGNFTCPCPLDVAGLARLRLRARIISQPQGQPVETSRLHLNVKTAVHHRDFHLRSQLTGNIHRLVGRMHRNRKAGPEKAKRRARLDNRLTRRTLRHDRA